MANPNNGLSLGIKKFNIDLMEPPENVKIPTISGTFVAGQVVTADPGEWTGSDLTFSYSFDGLISSNEPEYELTETDVETGVFVEVTATNRIGSVVAVSKTTPVAALTNLTLPTISGDFVVGETVTATSGTWNLNNELLDFTFSFNGNLPDVTVEDSAAYILQESDLAGVSVIVTASSNSVSVEVTSAVYAVEAAP